MEKELFDIPYCSEITSYSSFLKHIFSIISTSIYNWKEKLWKLIAWSLAFLCKGMCIALPILTLLGITLKSAAQALLSNGGSSRGKEKAGFVCAHASTSPCTSGTNFSFSFICNLLAKQQFWLQLFFLDSGCHQAFCCIWNSSVFLYKSICNLVLVPLTNVSIHAQNATWYT